MDGIRDRTDDVERAITNVGESVPSLSREHTRGLMLQTGGQEGSDMSDYLDQVDYIVDLVGHDHVGIGLDIAEE